MQETRVWSLIWEDSMCPGASKPVHHNRWACTVKPMSCNHWSPRTSEPTLCSERSHLSEKPGHEEEQPRSPQLEKSPHSNEDSAVKIQRQWLKLTSSLLTAFLKNHWDSVLNISRLVVFFFNHVMQQPITDNHSQCFNLPSWGPLKSNKSRGCVQDHSTNTYQVSTVCQALV